MDTTHGADDGATTHCGPYPDDGTHDHHASYHGALNHGPANNTTSDHHDIDHAAG